MIGKHYILTFRNSFRVLHKNFAAMKITNAPSSF